MKSTRKKQNLEATDAEAPKESRGSQLSKQKKPQASRTKKSVKNEPIFVVGIGASAGGLEAIEKFFDGFAPNSGMAFVVIQHLSPDFKSLMDELLSRHTTMPIHRVEDGMKVEPNAIYLIPPKKEMIISDGCLLLTDKDPEQALSLPINVFLRSLAQDRHEKAIGVILSGTGSDGSRGIREVHESGGLVIVQDEETAKFDGMPRSAIATGVADFVLPPDQMPDVIAQYVKDPQSRENIVLRSGQSRSEQGALSDIFSMLREQFGIDFNFYKPSTVGRRVERRLTMHGFKDLGEYLKYIDMNPEELSLLYKDLLIGVTKFFRDPEAFEILRETVVPEIIGRSTPNDEGRIWVAGCATGEEVYSYAILFHEYCQQHEKQPNLKIFATDVHRYSLDQASQGIFNEESVANVSPERMKRYFVKESNGYQVVPEIRRMVVFAQHNLIKDPPFTKMDMISCRNLLIYLQPIAQTKVLSLFHFGLKTRGILVLGPSETVGDLGEEFDGIDEHWRIYRKKRDVRLPAVDRIPIAPAISTGSLVSRMMTMTTQRGAQQDMGYGRAYEVLLEKYIPPSLLIRENGDLIHTFGDARQYLVPPSGRVSLNVLNMIEGELRLALGTAIQKALKEKKPVVYKGVRINTPDGVKRVEMIVECIQESPSADGLLLISFEEMQSQPAPQQSEERFDAGEASTLRIHDLERELQYSKEQLQTTIEELETSNEELQSTNEELLASNEELQSTNEELHSVNEELYTVNAEYEKKIDELTQLTNDMDNLLRSTDIGTIFVDRELCIRKYTPAVASIFNLMPQDVGRPIQHIAYNIDCPGFLSDLAKVLRTTKPIEHEVTDRLGRWLLMRILPYETDNKIVTGVVITFFDITALKNVEHALRQTQEQLEKRVEERTRELSTANRALKESEERYRVAAENSFDGFYLLRAVRDAASEIEDFEFIDLNSSGAELLGLAREEILGAKLCELLPFYRTRGFFEQYKRVMETGEPMKQEFPVDDPHYKAEWLRQQIVPIGDGIAISASDITDRKRAENLLMHERNNLEATVRERNGMLEAAHTALSESQELISSVFHSIQDGMIVMDNDLRIVKVNQTVERMAGSEPLEGTRCFERIHNRMTPCERCPALEVIETGEPQTRELAFETPGSEQRWHEVHSFPLKDKDGNTRGVVEHIRDITERKKGEEAMRSAKDFLKNVLDALTANVVVLDSMARIVMANRSWDQFAERMNLESQLAQKRALYGQVAHHVCGPSGTYAQEASKGIGEILKGKRDHFLLEYPLSVSGEPLWFEMRVSPFEFEGENGAIVSHTNIAERQQAKERLREYAEELMRSNQELEQFAYVASHDLQEPLRAIVSFSRMLKKNLEKIDDEDCTGDIDRITEAAGRMQALVDDLLELSRTGRKEMNKKKVDLNACMKVVLETLQESIQETGAQVEFDTLPTVWGDPTLLRQLYQNLVSNALKFRGQQTPQVLLSAEREDNHWVLGVKDNGVGFKPEYASQVFQPFRRLHKRKDYAGSGIGLAICRTVVERHGGRIWVETSPGEGSHFKFSIPKNREGTQT